MTNERVMKTIAIPEGVPPGGFFVFDGANAELLANPVANPVGVFTVCLYTLVARLLVLTCFLYMLMMILSRQQLLNHCL